MIYQRRVHSEKEGGRGYVIYCTRKSVLLGVPPITKKTKNDLKNDFVPDKELEFLVLPAASATSAARPTVWVGTTAPASPVSGLTGPANS